MSENLLPEPSDQDLHLPVDPIRRAHMLLDQLGPIELRQCCLKQGGCGGIMVWAEDPETPLVQLDPNHPKACELGNLIAAAPRLLRELLAMLEVN